MVLDLANVNDEKPVQGRRRKHRLSTYLTSAMGTALTNARKISVHSINEILETHVEDTASAMYRW